jgi:hypothetical protein
MRARMAAASLRGGPSSPITRRRMWRASFSIDRPCTAAPPPSPQPSPLKGEGVTPRL